MSCRGRARYFLNRERDEVRTLGEAARFGHLEVARNVVKQRGDHWEVVHVTYGLKWKGTPNDGEPYFSGQSYPRSTWTKKRRDAARFKSPAAARVARSATWDPKQYKDAHAVVVRFMKRVA